MNAPRVALATASHLAQGTADTPGLRKALAQIGIESSLPVWTDPDQGWDEYTSVLLHSPWDYSQRIDEFLSWVRATGTDHRMLNSRELIGWNSDKRYLVELEARGIALPPTVVADRGDQLDAEQLADRLGAVRLVVKPVIAAGGRRTWLADGAQQAVSILLRELSEEPVIVQSFDAAIMTHGELSAVYLDGELSHVVRKRPTVGEFRVQGHFGGSAEPEVAQPWIDEFGRGVLAALPEPAAYARVDFVADGQGEPWLMEVELIEPDLFLRLHPESFDRLAAMLGRGAG